MKQRFYIDTSVWGGFFVSWNFKHIVNVYRVRGYNAINMKLGYPILNIHSPKEIIGYGN